MVRYLNPADHNPGRITKADEYFAKPLDFKDIKFPFKVRDIHKFQKRIPLALAFLVMNIRKNIQSMSIYVSKKCCKEKRVDFLLIREEEENTMFLSMILIDCCMIIHYIVEESIFVVIVYMVSLQKKY